MQTAFRLVLALVAAITCCVAGWVALHATDVRQPPRSAGPVEVEVPPFQVAASKPPLAPVRSAAEASAGRADQFGDAAVIVRGELPAFPVTLSVRSGWSGVPLATRALDAKGVGTPLALANLPLGEHFAYLLPEPASTPRSYLQRARLVVPAPAAAPVELDARVAALRVRVRDAAGAPVSRALVQLERTDDPRWLAPPTTGTFPTPITGADGLVDFAPLGAGTYRVRVVDDEAPPVEVAVPATAEVTLTTAPRR